VPDGQSQFAGQKYLNLETFRKNGQGVATPVWFAEEKGVFYIYSLQESGKFKRIRNTPRCRVAPCDMRGRLCGQWVEATARILQGDEALRANELLNAKYGIQKRALDFLARLRATPRPRAYLAITLNAG
jgi:PPOX class probable F420-dependent enzyme